MTNRALGGIAGTLALVALLGVTGQAHAQAERGDGFEAALRVGYGLPLGKPTGDALDLSQGIAGMVPLWLDIGYRAMPELFVGLYGQYGFGIVGSQLDAACAQPGVDCSTSVIRLGAQAHYHPVPRGSVDPWLGLGFGYEWASWGASGGGEEFSLTPSGFEFLDLQLGLDVPVAKNFYLGPALSFSLGQYQSISVDCPAGVIDCGLVDGDIPNKSLHEWLVFAIRAAYAP